jgi:hypothetical protein
MARKSSKQRRLIVTLCGEIRSGGKWVGDSRSGRDSASLVDLLDPIDVEGV